MFTSLRRLAAGWRKRPPKAHRRLRVERLESRAVLSALSPAAPALFAEPSVADGAATLAGRDLAAGPAQAERDPWTAPAAQRDYALAPVDPSQASPPVGPRAQGILSLIETAVPCPSPLANAPAPPLGAMGEPDLSGTTVSLVGEAGRPSYESGEEERLSYESGEGGNLSSSLGNVGFAGLESVRALGIVNHPVAVVEIMTAPAARLKFVLQPLGADTVWDPLVSPPAARADRLAQVWAPFDVADSAQRGAETDFTAAADRWAAGLGSAYQHPEDAAGRVNPVDVLALHVRPEVEGGFVGLGTEPGLAAANPSLAPPEQPAAPRLSTSSGSLMEMLGPNAGRLASAGEGGLVALSSHELNTSAQRSLDQATGGVAGLAPPDALGLLELFWSAQSSLNPTWAALSSAFGTTRPPTLQTQNNTLENKGCTLETSSSTRERKTQSGLVNADSPSGSLTQSPTASRHTPGQPDDSPAHDLDGSIAAEFGSEGGRIGRARTGRPAAQAADQHARASDELQAGWRDFRCAYDWREGGLIELTSPAATSSEPWQTPDAAAWLARHQPALKAHDVRIEQAVGLFQAFELATIPMPRVDEADPILESPGQNWPRAESAAAQSPEDAAPPHEPGAARQESPQPPVHRAEIVPVILVGASLLPPGEGAQRPEMVSERRRRTP